KTYSSLALTDSMTTRVSGQSRAATRAASRPLSPGIMMSISTTSGRWDLIRLSASRPSAASPITSTPARLCSKRRMPARIRRWPSASNPRIGFMVCSFGVGRLGHGEAGADAGAVAGAGLDGQGAAEQLDSLLHAQKAEAGPLGRPPPGRLGVEADPVVADGQFH